MKLKTKLKLMKPLLELTKQKFRLNPKIHQPFPLLNIPQNIKTLYDFLCTRPKQNQYYSLSTEESAT